MKKFVYLCGMIFLSMNMMAQIDLNDRNWDTVFFDDFTEIGRYWGEDWLSKPVEKWMGFPGFGVTDGPGWYQVYQYSNCHFCPSEGQMKLVSEYDFANIIQTHQYNLPGCMHNIFPSSDSLFYFSGEIDVFKDFMQFQYGYFEIRCKLPKHHGAHSGFWLQNANSNPPDTFYEEIDIVEFSWSASDTAAHWLPVINPESYSTYLGDPRYYSTAISHNLHGQYVDYETDVYAMVYPHIPNEKEDINGWHIYACEWMPDHVYLYLDGNLVNSYYDKTHIPKHHLTLKTNYGIDRYYKNNGIVWMGSDNMIIDYIKVYQLQWQCDTDEIITNQSELNHFDYAVKKSVSIIPSNGEITIENTDKVTFRVTDSFEINGPFQVKNGAEFTVIRQDCPIENKNKVNQ